MLNKSLPVPGWGCPLRLHCLISDFGGCCPPGLKNGGGGGQDTFFSSWIPSRDPLPRHCFVILVAAGAPDNPPPACFLLCRWVCSMLSGGAAVDPCVCLIPGQLHLHVVCALTQSGEAWLLHQGPSVFLLACSWRTGSWVPDPVLQPKLWEEQEGACELWRPLTGWPIAQGAVLPSHE